jgi:hypothetical protein
MNRWRERAAPALARRHAGRRLRAAQYRRTGYSPKNMGVDIVAPMMQRTYRGLHQ